MDNLEIYFSDDPAQLEQAGWEKYVCSHQDGNFFQSPVAYRIFSNTSGYSPQVLGAFHKSNKSLCGILLSVTQQENGWYSGFTKRSIIWGGPLSDSDNISEKLIQEYDKSLPKTVIYTQIRNLFDQSTIKNNFELSGYRFTPHLNIIVNTSNQSESELLSSMSKSKARQIRKGLEHCTIEQCKNTEDLLALYQILKDLYRTKVKKPIPDYSFFRSFLSTATESGYGAIFLIRHSGKIIGGMIAPILPGKAIYEWYVAGEDFSNRESYPSVLATWAAIREGGIRHLNHFDFLGAGKPDADYGVREFKARFGGQEINFGRFEKIHRPLFMHLGKFGLKILSAMKSKTRG
jgi:lipid II:glycine glycyltransferase (peptidoglycan interpeptide bridge formation enzyme)